MMMVKIMRDETSSSKQKFNGPLLLRIKGKSHKTVKIQTTEILTEWEDDKW